MLKAIYEGTDEDARWLAFATLREMGPAALPEIKLAVKDLDHPFHNFAVSFWWEWEPGQPELVKILLARIGGSYLGHGAARMLSDLGEKAVDLLLPLYDPKDDRKERVRTQNVLLCLDMLGPKAVKALPVLLAKSGKSPVILDPQTARTIGSMGPAAAAAVPRLIEWVKEGKYPQLRSAAAWALGAIGPAAKGAVPHLLPLLAEDRHHTERTAAVGALRALGATEALPTLRNALDHEIPANRIRAAVAFVELGGDPAPALAALSELVRAKAWSGSTNFDPVNRHWPSRAGAAIAELGPTAIGALPVLIEILESDYRRPYDDPRDECAEAVAAIGPAAKAANPALTKLLDHERRRTAAAFALLKIGGHRKRAMEVLLDDYQHGVLWESAAEYLIELGKDANSAIPVVVSQKKHLWRARREMAAKILEAIRR